MRLPVEKDGLIFILPTLAASGILFLLRFSWTGTFVLLVAAFIVYFFRDPEREIPAGERVVLSPADGKIVTIKPFSDWRGPFVYGTSFYPLILALSRRERGK